MDFITVPVITGIVFYFVYMTFELFARKKERLMLIEKLGMNIAPSDPEILKVQFGSLLPAFKRTSFTSLRIGCLLLGLGIGLLAGLLINLAILNGFNFENNWQYEKLAGIGYGASVLFFGGLGLVISFSVENIISKRKKTKETD
jgi:hypothetical protein